MNMKDKLFFKKINPIIKFVLLTFITTLNAVANCLCSKFLLMVFSLLLTFLIKFKFKKIKKIFFFIFVSCLLNVFYSQGRVLLKLGIIQVTDISVLNFFMMLFSMLTFFFISLVMINSISSDDMPRISNFFLSPFKKLNINTSEISIIIILAMKFIPIILEESKKIILAQSSRGGEINKSLIKKIKYIVPVFVPIFISCFRRALNLATAMECRCYGASYNRTNLYENKFQKIDIISVIVVLVIFIGVILCNNVKIFYSF